MKQSFFKQTFEMKPVLRLIALSVAGALLPLALAMSQEPASQEPAPQEPPPSAPLTSSGETRQEAQSTYHSQEIVISDFPLGVGSSVSHGFFEPYYAELQKMVDTLNKYPMAQAVVTGSADGYQYHQSNDAKNNGLALGRAHALRNTLVNIFDVSPTRIIVQSIDVKEEGGIHRYVSLRITWQMTELQEQITTLALRPPIETRTIISPAIGIPEFDSPPPGHEIGLQLGAGITSSPFGSVPFVAAGATWKRTVVVEGVLGHTFWNNSFTFQGAKLQTKRRMAGAQLTIYPFEEKTVGLIAGWARFEEISQTFFKYVKLSEGPIMGLRAAPNDFLLVTGVYNPSNHRTAGQTLSQAKNNQFLLSVTAHVNFGGGM